MIVTYVRSSSYNNYDFCPMQYFMTYVLGHKSPSGKKAEIGTMTHKVMEVLASLTKFQQDNPKRKILEIVDDAIGNVKIHKDKIGTDEFVEWLCEESYQSYMAGSIHSWANADRKMVSKLSFEALEYGNGQFDPRNRKIIASEPHFDLPIEEDWAKFDYVNDKGETIQGQLAIKGTIDLVTEIDNNMIEVIDWKTGVRKDWNTGEEKTFAKMQKDPQLLLYYYAISRLYPDYKDAIMTIFFVKDGGPFSLCFDDSDRVEFLRMLKKQVGRIKKDKNPKPLSPTQAHWKCQRLCHFCKTDWEGTDQNMCSFVLDKLKNDGMEETIKSCTAEGHTVDFYDAPG